MTNQRDDEFDYNAEGKTPPRETPDPTNAGGDDSGKTGGARGLTRGTPSTRSFDDEDTLRIPLANRRT